MIDDRMRSERLKMHFKRGEATVGGGSERDKELKALPPRRAVPAHRSQLASDRESYKYGTVVQQESKRVKKNEEARETEQRTEAVVQCVGHMQCSPVLFKYYSP